MAATLDGSDWTAPEAQPSLVAFHRSVYLIMLSVLPVFAAAAGLDVEAMGWEDFARLRKHYFFGQECEA